MEEGKTYKWNGELLKSGSGAPLKWTFLSFKVLRTHGLDCAVQYPNGDYDILFNANDKDRFSLFQIVEQD